MRMVIPDDLMPTIFGKVAKNDSRFASTAWKCELFSALNTKKEAFGALITACNRVLVLL